jgi:hypothetical protein
MAQSPCFLSPLAESLLLPLRIPFTYLETLLALTGSVHLGLRLLVNWPPLYQPFPQSLPPPNSQNPGYQAPHYDNLKNPASSVRNNKYGLIEVYLIEVYPTLYSRSTSFRWRLRRSSWRRGRSGRISTRANYYNEDRDKGQEIKGASYEIKRATSRKACVRRGAT